ncbi:MAG: hypothetical protein IJ830_06140 [Alphaproteobacteria bacterium]|nr:hypothetical protein [Alphaproteobacteria bacterium]
MIKFLKILALLLIWTAAGVGAAYYFGGQPLVTYYPDGKIRTSTPRRFFIPNGLATVYHSNGTISEQYTYVDGVKSGIGYIYFAGQRLKVNYEKGVLSGPATFENTALFKDKLKPTITFLPQNMIQVALNKDDLKINFKAERLCKDEILVAHIQQYTSDFEKSKLKDVLACLAFENGNFVQQNFRCSFNGDYRYPALKKDLTFNCNFPYQSESVLSGIENLQVSGNYALSDDKLSVEIFDPQKPTSKMVSSYGGINKMIQGISQMLINAKPEKYPPQIVSLMFEYLTFSNAYLMLNDQKIWDVSGDFNMMHGFSDPYYISSYMDDQITSQFKVDQSGANLKALYPIGKKPMFLLGLRVDEAFKTRYQALAKEVLQVLSSNFDSNTSQTSNLIADISEYFDDFSSLIKNVYTTLYDNNGQKVISAVIAPKPDLESSDLTAAPLMSFSSVVTLYENNQPVHQVTGDFEQGFLIDGRKSTEEEVFALLGNEHVLAVLQDIGEELDQKFAPMIENGRLFDNQTAVDPFLLGLYLGYMQFNPKAQEEISLSDEVDTIAQNIRTLYADNESYEGLTEDIAIEYGSVPEEMLSDEDNAIYHSYGGLVYIHTDAASKDGYDGEAFVITLDNLPSEICIDLATKQWDPANDGFIGVAATANDFADVSAAYIGEVFEGRPAGMPYGRQEAISACGATDTASVAFKFY